MDFLSAKESVLRATSVARYRELVGRWREWFEKYRVVSWHHLTPGLIEEYVADGMKTRAPKTIDDELSLLKGILKWLWRRGEIQEIPVRQWPSVGARPKNPDRLGVYSPAQIDALLAHFKFLEFGPSLHFLVFTGARRSELWAAKVMDVSGGVVTLRSEKTVRDPSTQFRAVPIHPTLAPILAERTVGRKPGDPLFPELARHSLNWPAVQLQNACKELGIPYRRAHGLRHTFISGLLKGGADLRQVMAAAGHRDIQTTQGYLHLIDDLADVVRLPFGKG
jgi:integrase